MRRPLRLTTQRHDLPVLGIHGVLLGCCIDPVLVRENCFKYLVLLLNLI
jgi:hypothetical protein